MKRYLNSFLVYGKSKYLESILKHGDYGELQELQKALKRYRSNPRIKAKPEYSTILKDRLEILYYANLALAC